MFIGTTNKSQYLKDETGGRRFWPVKVAVVRPIDTDLLTGCATSFSLRRCIGSEPANTGGPMMRSSVSISSPNRKHGSSRMLGKKPSLIFWTARKEVTVLEVARGALVIDTARLGTADQRRVTAILERLGWERGKME